MKYVMLFLGLFLAACSNGGGSSSSLATQPINLPPAIETPPPGAPALVWPPVGAVSTVTLGSTSCSSLALGMKCTDGTSIYSWNALNFFQISDIKISADVICGLYQPNGPAVDCSSLGDPSCTAPATNNSAFCMNVADFNLVNMIAQGDHIGFGSPTFQSGTKSISVVSGQMCIETTAYLSGAAFDSNTLSCGTSVNTAGHLE